jgi:hypothetical protein
VSLTTLLLTNDGRVFPLAVVALVHDRIRPDKLLSWAIYLKSGCSPQVDTWFYDDPLQERYCVPRSVNDRCEEGDEAEDGSNQATLKAS